MKKIIILFLLLLLVSCSKEGKEEVSTNQSEAEFVSTNQSDNQFIIFDKTTKFTFRTIEYYGIVYDPDSDRISHYIELGIPLPFLPKVALEIPPKPEKLNYESYGIVCNGTIPVAQPLTDVPISFIADNQSNLVNVCVNTSFEYKSVTIGKYNVDTHFTAEDCNKSIFKQDNKTYINLSHRKISCIN